MPFGGEGFYGDGGGVMTGWDAIYTSHRKKKIGNFFPSVKKGKKGQILASKRA